MVNSFHSLLFLHSNVFWIFRIKSSFKYDRKIKWKINENKWNKIYKLNMFRLYALFSNKYKMIQRYWIKENQSHTHTVSLHTILNIQSGTFSSGTEKLLHSHKVWCFCKFLLRILMRGRLVQEYRPPPSHWPLKITQYSNIKSIKVIKGIKSSRPLIYWRLTLVRYSTKGAPA